jgi:opacity protein-like surface antigen
MAGAVVAQTKTDSAFYVGVDAAYATTSAGSVSGYRKTSETTNVGLLRLLGGYQFNQNIALELGYFTSGDFKQAGTNGSISYNTKSSVKGVDLAGIYKFTEVVPGLFLKAGITSSKVDASATATSGSAFASASGSASGTGYLAGLGYDLNITGGLDARLGYTRYERLGGQSANKLNVFSAGLKYRF